ncbi:MAG: ABC-F family ATP-binding cassette domain-containing protein [Odoribacteraceae bacterium]|nr:ABC-F family ATP-binding cassette domain-containing protein [Odoribacteraceae bacterium]
MQIILQVDRLSKRYGERVLFEEISLGIGLSRKVALVARNGQGKSTLLNIIAGKETADSGNVTLRGNVTVGYLEQEPALDPASTVFDEVFHSPSPTLSLVKEHERAMAANDSEALERLIPLMDASGAWNRENRAREILSRLALDRQRDRLVRDLSGGERKRVGLARVLINDPDFLLLDEPTNHLDAEMVEWLEEYLDKSQATLLMVTHDRYFLDRVCDTIVEIDNGEAYSHAGNYTRYLERKEERAAEREAAVDRARSLLRAEREWMLRMPRARGHKAKYRVDSFRELEEAAARGGEERVLQLDTRERRLGSKILEMKRVSKRYGDLCLLDDFSYTFSRGEKIGIIGKNGVGKTTFLDMITGKTAPDNGTIDTGSTVVHGYYTQAGITFNEEDRPIDIVREIAEYIHTGDGKMLPASRFLEYFLFPGKLQYTPVGKLSGGERKRLYLLTVLAREPNFLVLDEPTNDLDLVTLNVLEEYARAFRGCLIVASHDRFFMDKIVDHLFVFEGDGRVKDFPGNYSIYREARENIAKEPREKKRAPAVIVEKEKEKKKRLSFREQQEMDQLEVDMRALEEEKKTLELALDAGTLDIDALTRSSRRLAEILENLDEMETRWLVLSDI